MAEINKIVNKKTERNSNIELLRILVTLFVIILHYNNANNGKAFSYTQNILPANYQFLLLFEMFAICAVNVFVLISGYFMCNSKKADVTKILRLYFDVIFFSVFRYVLLCMLKRRSFSVSNLISNMIPLNWYVAVYTSLYLISPYLNKIIRGMKEKRFRTMLLILILVFSVWPSALEFITFQTGKKLTSLNPISIQGSTAGYSIVNFVVLYMFGAYIRQHYNDKRDFKTALVSLLIYVFSSILLTVYANTYFSGAVSYCNPFVILQSVSLFKAFQCLNIKSKLINSLASCSFAVYLMHSFFFSYAKIEQYVTGRLRMILVHIIASSIIIYLLSAIIYKIYFFISNPVLTWCQKKLSFLTYEVE